MHALLKVSPGVSNDDFRHARRQQSAESDGDVAWDIQRRTVAAEQFLLSQPKDLYGQQLSTLFNEKLQQLAASILQKVRKHDSGDLQVAIGDLKLLPCEARVVHSKMKNFSNDGLRTKGDLHGNFQDLIRGKRLASSRCRPSDPQEAGEKSCWWTRSTSFSEKTFAGKTYCPCVTLDSKAVASLFLKI